MTFSRFSIVLLFIVLIAGAGWWYFHAQEPSISSINVNDSVLVAQGSAVYARECAACHGRNLEGQTPDWRRRLPDGNLPAPPHDETGHTWHHPDTVLFEITKFGRVKAAPPDHTTNMPAFKERLSDQEIWAVLSYIKDQWPYAIKQRHDALNQRYRAVR